MEEDFLVCEGGFFKLYLVVDSVSGEVGAFVEGDVVFCPLLSEAFGDYLLEDFASVVLGALDDFVELFDGADNLGLASQQVELLHRVGLEAEGVARAAACLVQLRHIGEGAVIGVAGVDRALVGVAEDIAVGVRAGAIGGNKCLIDGGVHWGISSPVFCIHCSTQFPVCQQLIFYRFIVNR